MNNDNKLNITATGEKLLLGNETFILDDETRTVFEASDAVRLAAYLEGCPGGVSAFDVYIGASRIEAFDRGEDINRQSQPYGSCGISEHPIVSLLRAKNGLKMGLNDFTIFLQKVKPYLGSDSLFLLDNISDLKIQKVLSIDHKNDRRGNYNFSVKAERGNKDYEFPQTVKFNIPILKGVNGNVREVEFGFYFEWSVAEESVKLNFSIENFELQVLINDLADEILEAVFESKIFFIHHGTLAIIKQSDEWKYKRNDLVIKHA